MAVTNDCVYERTCILVCRSESMDGVVVLVRIRIILTHIHIDRLTAIYPSLHTNNE